MNLSFGSENPQNIDEEIEDKPGSSIFKFTKKPNNHFKKNLVDESEIIDGRLKNFNQGNDKKMMKK